jgi:hypothetical protein
MSQSSGQGGVDISTLTVQQLSALQARLSQELEHLSTSYQRLRAAQARFKDCIKSVQDGVQGRSGGMYHQIIFVARQCRSSPQKQPVLTTFFPCRNTPPHPTNNITLRSRDARDLLFDFLLGNAPGRYRHRLLRRKVASAGSKVLHGQGRGAGQEPRRD